MDASTEKKAKRVLVVDDETTIVQVLERILTANGYEALSATHWTDAMDRLEHDQPDLVLLDLAMPHVDGCSLFEFIRDQGYDIPVIVVSAHITDEVAKGLRALGVSAIVWKPFGVSEILAEVERAIGPPVLEEVTPDHERIDLLNVLNQTAGVLPEDAAMELLIRKEETAKSDESAPAEPEGRTRPPSPHHAGRRHGRRRSARSARRRTILYMSGIALVCVLAAGLLMAAQRYVSGLDFGGLRLRAAESMNSQASKNASRAETVKDHGE